MASYEVLIKEPALLELASISRKQDLRKIAQRISSLAQQPRPLGCEKLSGSDRYRVRQGDFRIIYEVSDSTSTVVVVKIGNRRDVYRRP
ncbi:MAG TPA: type II toxin-antitoxin system RelE/ParE family toxin [Trueperaceae bacterium]|nr:type II toxin-antitoxin system RelE/ParE family toxin [Trueperaceae bacterium]